jgi:hypothetical protein
LGDLKFFYGDFFLFCGGDIMQGTTFQNIKVGVQMVENVSDDFCAAKTNKAVVDPKSYDYEREFLLSMAELNSEISSASKKFK